MNSNIYKKQEAIKLRKLGWSYSQIMQKIDVQKSTLSYWFNNLTLEPSEIKRMEKNSIKLQTSGRLNAALKNRERRILRDTSYEENAQKLFEKYKNDSMFLVGISLYWAEGAKKDNYFSFINSDPDMVKFMVDWSKKYLKFKAEKFRVRLFIHKPYKNKDCEKYWLEKLNFSKDNLLHTIYKPTLHTIQKNLDYMGCLRITYSGVEHIKTVKTWQKLIIEYYR